MPDTTQEELEKRLKAQGIARLQKDIRLMNREELAQHFASKNSGRIILTRLIKSIIWQAYEKIQAGEEDLGGGNIRTFWYRWVQPTLAHMHDDDSHKTSPYQVMTEMFSDLVMNEKLLRYRDFDFTDENWNNRFIGSERGDILIFSEKRGWMRFLTRLHKDLGVSVLALGSFPSALTSEYTSHALQDALGSGKSVRLIGIVDYDFSGALIAKSFRTQLEATGLKIHSMQTMIHPKHYESQEIQMFKVPLPKRQKTKLAAWLKKTGGIDGQPFGLESESMPIGKLRKMIEELVEQDG